MSRRGHLLEFAVLGLLHEGPTHGYDLRRRLNTALGPFRALSYGTLYPALRSLLDRGLIAETEDPAAAGRRRRVVYELTAANARWIGAELRDLELYLELTSRSDSIEVGGLLTTREGDVLRDIVVISPVLVPRRRGKPVPHEPSDAGTPEPAAAERGAH